MRRKIKPVILLLFFLIIPATALCASKGQVKHLTSITGNSEIGRFGLLGGIFFDENRNRLYFTDTTNGRILAFVFNDEFKYISKFTGGGALTSPTSIVKDSKGNFFVAEPGKGNVLAIDIERKSIKTIDFSAVSGANPIYPGNMAIDSEDRLYIADKANQRILLFDSNLQFKKQILVKGSRGLKDVKVDETGRIYVLSTIDGSICVYNSEGNLLLRFGSRGSGKGEFDFPTSLAVDQKGLIYVADQHKNQVLVFNDKGRFLYAFSQSGWREGRLYRPSFICVNSSGRIFVVDRANTRISVFE
ncbi:MAG TPA: NHL repeat-containing protein [Anaerolineae bacterium]|nr:NHL repeat-containing protein [Anaerolineae bacterium]